MKILLIQPPAGHQLGYDRIARVEPLGLESLAASVRGHEVRLLDLRVRDGLEETLRTFPPDVCGLSCSFTMGVNKTLECARRIKHACPSSLVVAGGVHPSIAPTDLHDPAIDILAKGEGEALISDLVATVDRGGDLHGVRGIFLNQDGQQIYTGRRELLADLDQLPLPRRDLSQVPRTCYHFNFWRPLALLETTRGCPYRCNFCSVWRFYQGKNRHKSAERVVAELLALDERFVLITDDNFLDDIPRARQIVETLLAKGVDKRYSAQLRADAIAANPDLIDLWYQAGLRHVFVGFEAVSDERLAELHKDTSLTVADEAMRVLLRYHDLSVTGSFIVDPQFTAEDFERLRRYVREKRISAPQFSILTPLPGTRLFRERKDELVTHNYDMFDFMHCVLRTRLELEQFYTEFASLYRSAYEAVGVLPFGRISTLIKGLATRRFTVGQVAGVLHSMKDLGRPSKYIDEHRRFVVAPGASVGNRCREEAREPIEVGRQGSA